MTPTPSNIPQGRGGVMTMTMAGRGGGTQNLEN